MSQLIPRTGPHRIDDRPVLKRTSMASVPASAPLCVQPDHFYPTGIERTREPGPPGTFYHPDDDPTCTRGIPVFKPTMDEFADFEKYMERVDVWGRKSGIVKIIPPQEW